MITGFLSEAAANRITNVILPRGFATSKQIGNVQTITFHRDAEDGGDTPIGPFEVLVVLNTGGTPQQGDDGSVSYVGYTGEFQSDDPDFAVARADRFCLNDGSCGSVTSGSFADIAFIRAPFVIER